MRLDSVAIAPDFQPHLTGSLVELRPIAPEDWDALFAVAADPLVWEQHPNNDRHERKVFEFFFVEALASKGALVAIDRASGRIIGSSRYYGWNAEARSVAIGFTFLARACWEKGYNRDMKDLMLRHAFKFAKTVIFHIGEHNKRSRAAIEKIGARLIRTEARVHADGRPNPTVVYALDENAYIAAASRLSS